MQKMKQIKAQDILSTNHIIKFFDNERFAENLLRDGEMLFRPIKSFVESNQAGRGDANEGKVKCRFSLYVKEPSEKLYNKLGDVTSVNLDVDCPIYCYSQLRLRNFHPDGRFYFNPKMVNDFGSGKQTYCAMLERTQFEKRVMDFFNANDIVATIANVKYSDSDVDYEIIRQLQTGESDLAYFQKSKIYEEQQERRIVIREHINSLIKRGIGKEFREGIIIKIGSLSDIGHIGMPVNF